MAIPNSAYPEILSATLDTYSRDIADNVENHNALLAWMKKRGNTKPVPGGVKILENLMYAENSTGRWFSGLEFLDVGGSDVLTSAQFEWKEYNVNVVMSSLEMAQNNGSKETVHSLVEAKTTNADKTARNAIGAALFYSNTESSGKAIGGLQHLVADLPTSGTVGGISRVSDTWWRNQYYDFSTEGITASATTIQAAMNTVWLNTQRGQDRIDLFIAGITYYNYYLTSLQQAQRFTNMESASAGFPTLKYMGGSADVVFDANCAATRMYGIQTEYICYRPHSEWNFVTTSEKAPTNQAGVVMPLMWKGNMTLRNASQQAVITA